MLINNIFNLIKLKRYYFILLRINMKINHKELTQKITLFKIALHIYLVKTNNYEKFFKLIYKNMQQTREEILGELMIDGLKEIDDDLFFALSKLFI